MDNSINSESEAGDSQSTVVHNNRTVPISDEHTKQQLKICTYNIWHGGGSRLTLAIKAIKYMNIDIAVFTETKLQPNTYTHGAYGHTVYATESQHEHQGGVTLIIKDSTKFVIEGVQKHGPNVIRAILRSGTNKWLIIGCYVPPGDTDHGDTLNNLQRATIDSYKFQHMILLGDLNTHLDNMINATPRQEEVAASITSLGLRDLQHHFKIRQNKRWTWHQVREGLRLESTLDYILTKTTQSFRCFKIKTPLHYDSDHRMVVTILEIDNKINHKKYMRSRTRYPFVVESFPTEEQEILFQDIIEKKERTQQIIAKEPEDWISNNSHELFKRKALARWRNDKQQIKQLRKELRKSLRNDRINRVNKTASEAEGLMKGGDIIQAYHVLQKWYRCKGEKTTNPTYQDMSLIETEYQQLYAKRDVPEQDIPTHVQFEIKDDVPEEQEIIQSLFKLKNGKSPGATGLTVEQLKEYYRNARTVEEPKIPDIQKWENIIKIIQFAFEGGKIPIAFKRGILKLLPKPGSTGFRGIALLESMYKLISMIIHRRLMEAVKFHDSIHGFRRNRGTATAIINLKLKMQLAKREKIPLYMVFIDIKKAYDSVDRTKTLKLLQKYGLGKNITTLLTNIWDGDIMIPKQQQFFGKPFRTERGVKQGDIVSPTIFNIIIDAVVRQTIEEMIPKNTENKTTIQFYADDGVLAGKDYDQIQQMLGLLEKNFKLFGLEISIDKTEMMTMHAKLKHTPISVEAYDRKVTGVGATYKEKQQMMTECQWCHKVVQKRSLKRHQLSATCIRIKKQNSTNDNNIATHIDNEIQQTKQTESKIFEIDMPPKVLTKCPHEKCLFTTNNKTKMRRHFRSRHLDNIIIIQQEGVLPQCHQCGLFQNNVNSDKHLNSDDCKRYTEIKNNIRLDICNKATTNVKFHIDGKNIKKVNDFKYLGRIIDSTDDDSKALQNQITKAKAVWGRIGKLLKMRADSNVKIMSIFYKVIIQTVLLYGSESWVLTEQGKSKLRTFHNKCARFMTGRYITKIDEEWVYPETKKTLELADLLTIDEYIMKRRNTLEEYALETDIYDECITKSLYIKADNTLQWWTENHNNFNINSKNNNNYTQEMEDINNINNKSNETSDIEYNNFDPDEIQIEWGTENGNSEMENNNLN